VRTILSGGKIVTPTQVIENHTLILESGKISAIIPDQQSVVEKNDHTINTKGKWVTPGLIDIHVHGANYADAMDADLESINTLNQFFASRGVTGYLLTTGTASNSDISAVINCFQEYSPTEDGAVPLGIHLEGPYLCEERKGAQPSIHLRDPEPVYYQRWFESGVIRLMTVAPELEGTLALIQTGIKQGVEFAVGHSVASYEVMQDVIERGLRQAAHTFNGMNPLHHRQPGVLGAVLSDDRLFAQIIADGVHVHPAVVNALVKAKGINRTILITDSIRAAGMGNGEYDLLGQTVSVKGNVARIASGSLAGSVLTMDQAVRNAMAFCDIPFAHAIQMASLTPAKSLNLHTERGALEPGLRADVTIFSQDYSVETTIVGGNIVYQKD
jgi:N-acetylglucosamine-6-phosphate deacetylase